MSAASPSIHPVLTCLKAVEEALDEVAHVNPVFMSIDDRAAAMERIAAAQARLAELELRLIASSADVAVTDAARDVAAWQVAHNRRDIRTPEPISDSPQRWRAAIRCSGRAWGPGRCRSTRRT